MKDEREGEVARAVHVILIERHQLDVQVVAVHLLILLVVGLAIKVDELQLVFVL